jgi:hypothetical protein
MYREKMISLKEVVGGSQKTSKSTAQAMNLASQPVHLYSRHLIVVNDKTLKVKKVIPINTKKRENEEIPEEVKVDMEESSPIQLEEGEDNMQLEESLGSSHLENPRTSNLAAS